MGLGENIKYFRKKLGLNQDQLAERLGVGQTTVSAWESDTTFPRINQVKKMAEVFSVFPNILLGSALIQAPILEGKKAKEHSGECPILSSKEILDEKLRLKKAGTLYFPSLYQPEFKIPNAIRYRIEDDSMTPLIIPGNIIHVQLNGPFDDGHIVIFHDTIKQQVLVRQFRIIDQYHMLIPLSVNYQPLSFDSGHSLRYIGTASKSLHSTPPSIKLLLEISNN